MLIQPYERRVLTYVPTAPEGFKVQMGNIGQHYYQWRYGTIPAPAPPPPAASNPPPPTPTPTQPPRANCDPSYPDVCIPPPPPDLDCGDIPHRNFRVLPPDPHRFDTDRDGIGCET